MLLFIRVVQAKKAWYNYISIHLMLLFIFLFFQQRYQHLKFQYISCYCLSLYVRSIWQKKLISIHLMLLFIKKTGLPRSPIPRFQYISCYCLSRLYSCCQPSLPHFNTSHVTVYPRPLSRIPHKTIFQYISCYCLSNELTPFYIFLRI